MGKYAIYHVFRRDDPISFSHKKDLCPSIKPIGKKYAETLLFSNYGEKAKKLMTPIMKREYGATFAQNMDEKFETLRFAYFYDMKPRVPITSREGRKLKEAKRLLQLRKGYFLPVVDKLGCHHVFHQFLNLFDYAAALNAIGEESFQKIALFYHKIIASRDQSYIPRYKWLMSNPEILGKLKAVIFENHDDLVFLIMRAITKQTHKDIATPFASLIVIELHKGGKDNSYYIKVIYNKVEVILRMSYENKISLKKFAKVMKRKGMFLNDQEFYSVCYGKEEHKKPLKLR